jgi:hypothetical protein
MKPRETYPHLTSAIVEVLAGIVKSCDETQARGEAGAGSAAPGRPPGPPDGATDGEAIREGMA